MPSSTKKAYLSSGVRLVLGAALVALLSFGALIGLHLFFQPPPTEAFTLPAIPVDTAPSKALIAAVAANPANEADTAAAGESAASPPAPAASKKADTLEELRRQLAESTNPAAALFLQIASASSNRGLATEATQVLRDGLTRHPENEALRIALADHLFDTGAPSEAWELIARAGHLSDSRFASRLLTFSLAAGRADETLVILAAAGKTLPGFSAEDWLLIVRLHEETGQIDRAIEIAGRRVNDRAEIFRLRARQAQQAGQVPEAIFHQEQFLAHLKEPSAKEWRNLAELYASDGRTEETAHALRQADAATAPAAAEVP